MSLRIGGVVCSLINGDSVANSLIGGRIFSLCANEGAKKPFAVFRRTNIQSNATKDMFDSGDTVSVEVVVVADDYDQSIECAEAVRLAIEKRDGQFEQTSFSTSCLVGGNEAYDGDFFQSLVINIETDNL